MNHRFLAFEIETEAPGGDLRPSKTPPRPIGCPKKRPMTLIGGGR